MVLGLKMAKGSLRDSVDLLACSTEQETSWPQACWGTVGNELVFLKAAAAGVSKSMAKCCQFWFSEKTERCQECLL